MALIAVYDACVLFPATLRDLMLRLAAAGLVQPRWSDRILDECFRSILAHRPDLSEAALKGTRAKMCAVFPDAMVEQDEQLSANVALPDPDDVHVLATAVASGASTIVTFNLRDFPASALEVFGVQAVHPDDFVLGRIEAAPGRACAVIEGQALALRKPPTTSRDLIARLNRQGLPRSAARLSDLLGSAGGGDY